MKSIYLDYAAATPMDLQVIKAMQPYFNQQFYNASATYLAGKEAHQDLEKARAKVAALLGAKVAEIVFTAGGTEANNLAIQGIMREYPGAEILASAIEHESVLAPAELFNYKIIPVSKKGIIDLEKLEEMISRKSVLISIMMVNNELGTIQPLREIAALVKKVRKARQQAENKLPLWLHSDGAQAPNYLDIHVSRLGVDLLTLNGGKIYGPKYSGALYVKAGVKMMPLILGGGQEFNLRSGTENIAGAIGFAAALELAQKMRETETARVTKLRKLFLNLLVPHQNLSGAVGNQITERQVFGAGLSKGRFILNGDLKHSSPHILNISFPGFDNERLMMQLDELGIQVATGSACSAKNTQASHVLTAIGLPGKMARASLRFSFGRATAEKDIQKTVEILAKLTST